MWNILDQFLCLCLVIWMTFSIDCLALLFQNNILFQLIFSGIDNRQTITQTLNIKYFYIQIIVQIHKQLIFSLAYLYHPTNPYLLMFTYTATISKKLWPAELIPSQLTSRPGSNFTNNNVSDRATKELKASQLTSCNSPLNLCYFLMEPLSLKSCET